MQVEGSHQLPASRTASRNGRESSVLVNWRSSKGSTAGLPPASAAAAALGGSRAGSFPAAPLPKHCSATLDAPSFTNLHSEVRVAVLGAHLL